MWGLLKTEQEWTMSSNSQNTKNFSAVRNLRDVPLSNNHSKEFFVSQEGVVNEGIPDDELVYAAQRGNIQAFEHLVLRYQRQIFSLIYQMTRNVDVVEDLGQDVFVAAFRAIKDFQAKSSFFTWLYRIAINHCKNYAASSNRAKEFEQRYQQEYSDDDDSEYQARNPERSLLAKEFVEQMEAAIGMLPEEQRTVLVLCEFEGLSYQDIADVLECPVGTVRSRLSRARTTLQDLMGDAGAY
jgi:RNA polymerase sigma-70 factor (ECF subfamily)